ncbi:MAG: hypothetical protein AB1540_04690 [Bdellovibrionota bacterium]
MRTSLFLMLGVVLSLILLTPKGFADEYCIEDYSNPSGAEWQDFIVCLQDPPFSAEEREALDTVCTKSKNPGQCFDSVIANQINGFQTSNSNHVNGLKDYIRDTLGSIPQEWRKRFQGTAEQGGCHGNFGNERDVFYIFNCISRRAQELANICSYTEEHEVAQEFASASAETKAFIGSNTAPSHVCSANWANMQQSALGAQSMMMKGWIARASCAKHFENFKGSDPCTAANRKKNPEGCACTKSRFDSSAFNVAAPQMKTVFGNGMVGAKDGCPDWLVNIGCSKTDVEAAESRQTVFEPMQDPSGGSVSTLEKGLKGLLNANFETEVQRFLFDNEAEKFIEMAKLMADPRDESTSLRASMAKLRDAFSCSQFGQVYLEHEKKLEELLNPKPSQKLSRENQEMNAIRESLGIPPLGAMSNAELTEAEKLAAKENEEKYLTKVVQASGCVNAIEQRLATLFKEVGPQELRTIAGLKDWISNVPLLGSVTDLYNMLVTQLPTAEYMNEAYASPCSLITDPRGENRFPGMDEKYAKFGINDPNLSESEKRSYYCRAVRAEIKALQAEVDMLRENYTYLDDIEHAKDDPFYKKVAGGYTPGFGSEHYGRSTPFFSSLDPKSREDALTGGCVGLNVPPPQKLVANAKEQVKKAMQSKMKSHLDRIKDLCSIPKEDLAKQVVTRPDLMAAFGQHRPVGISDDDWINVTKQACVAYKQATLDQANLKNLEGAIWLGGIALEAFGASSLLKGLAKTGAKIAVVKAAEKRAMQRLATKGITDAAGRSVAESLIKRQAMRRFAGIAGKEAVIASKGVVPGALFGLGVEKAIEVLTDPAGAAKSAAAYYHSGFGSQDDLRANLEALDELIPGKKIGRAIENAVIGAALSFGLNGFEGAAKNAAKRAASTAKRNLDRIAGYTGDEIKMLERVAKQNKFTPKELKELGLPDRLGVEKTKEHLKRRVTALKDGVEKVKGTAAAIGRSLASSDAGRLLAQGAEGVSAAATAAARAADKAVGAAYRSFLDVIKDNPNAEKLALRAVDPNTASWTDRQQIRRALERPEMRQAMAERAAEVREALDQAGIADSRAAAPLKARLDKFIQQHLVANFGEGTNPEAWGPENLSAVARDAMANPDVARPRITKALEEMDLKDLDDPDSKFMKEYKDLVEAFPDEKESAYKLVKILEQFEKDPKRIRKFVSCICPNGCRI